MIKLSTPEICFASDILLENSLVTDPVHVRGCLVSNGSFSRMRYVSFLYTQVECRISLCHSADRPSLIPAMLIVR